jgi:hypothetical protein
VRWTDRSCEQLCGRSSINQERETLPDLLILPLEQPSKGARQRREEVNHLGLIDELRRIFIILLPVNIKSVDISRLDGCQCRILFLFQVFQNDRDVPSSDI